MENEMILKEISKILDRVNKEDKKEILNSSRRVLDSSMGHDASKVDATLWKRRERAEDIAKRFMCLDDTDKQYITGYMAGIQVERQKWEEKLAAAGIPVLELLVKPKLIN